MNKLLTAFLEVAVNEILLLFLRVMALCFNRNAELQRHIEQFCASYSIVSDSRRIAVTLLCRDSRMTVRRGLELRVAPAQAVLLYLQDVSSLLKLPLCCKLDLAMLLHEQRLRCTGNRNHVFKLVSLVEQFLLWLTSTPWLQRLSGRQ